MSISVSIVIVNWNTGDMLGDCCRSIVGADMAGIALNEVIVVDNASTDKLRPRPDRNQLPLHLVVNDDNKVLEPLAIRVQRWQPVN
ncbi:glycosyltransferase family 2 protein [Candidatus Aalborgicola defluviihabitans]|uniref:glycosyltransferase family 2 protein n=1 Tax=Candidatus Aalborgicola defluviihabitans TaxID=3386187 RepID=UPI001D7527D0|nr:hypothetical protein [Burkholderiales bacterium]